MSARHIVSAALLLLASLVGAARGEEPHAPASAASKPSPAQVGAWRKRLLQIRKQYFSREDLEGQALWDEGKAKIAAIDDPAAVPAIVKLLETEKAQFRRALIQPLITIGGKEAVACLVKWSVEDRNPLIRQEACHGLAEKEELPGCLPAYIAYLQPVRQGLDVRFATEAAEALTMTRLAAPLGPGEAPNEKLVRVLASALDTAPVFIKQIDSTPIKAAIPDPRDSKVRQKRKTPLAGVLPTVETPNPVVLATLQEYTGEDFQYDEKAWLAWLAERLKE